MNSQNKVCVGLSLHFQTCSFVFKTMDLVERTTCVKIHKKQIVFAQVWQKVHLLKLKQKLLKATQFLSPLPVSSLAGSTGVT